MGNAKLPWNFLGCWWYPIRKTQWCAQNHPIGRDLHLCLVMWEKTMALWHSWRIKNNYKFEKYVLFIAEKCEVTSCHYHEYRKSSVIYHCTFENVEQSKCWIEKKTRMLSPSLGRSLNLYNQLETWNLKTSHIQHEDFILKFSPTRIYKIWNELPEKLQKDGDIIAHRRCHERYDHIAIDNTKFEGIIPHMKNCSICK